MDIGRIQSAVQSASSSQARNLSVRQNGNQFEVHGQADSIAAKQETFSRITSQVGDTAGLVNMIQVSSEKPAQQTPASQAQPGGAAKTHTVAKGETLSGIAQKYYGKASLYPKIAEANRDKISDPDKIREGMVLQIPA
jgi:nucleoid-associated protein YgaU